MKKEHKEALTAKGIDHNEAQRLDEMGTDKANLSKGTIINLILKYGPDALRIIQDLLNHMNKSEDGTSESAKE
jgi:hypothetical protein